MRRAPLGRGVIGRGPTGHLGTARREDGVWEAICWAPRADSVAVLFPSSPQARVRLEPRDGGYFSGELGERPEGDRYWFELDGQLRVADPASRAQPDGVGGPSALFDPATYVWSDADFSPPSLRDLVLYELHVGTFRAKVDPSVPGGVRPGTFATAESALPDLVGLGVTAVEPLPIAAFPGERNWGYDGVFPFAVHEPYGGPAGFQRFVDAAHRSGLAVVLDVVYNHFGPEGSVHRSFAPYVSDRYQTPWGEGMNVDGPGSDEVRRYFFENALSWFVDFHVDGLRLDAIHGIIDTSARPFLAELSDLVGSHADTSDRPFFLIAESEDNNPRVIEPTASGGFGMDAQWADDFHHSLHVALTGERRGYYGDYAGTPDLAKAIGSGFSFTGQFSRSRSRRHGAPPTNAVPGQFTVAIQNHDQVGNRPGSERLSSLVSPSKLRIAAGVLICSPHTPLIFMGEEDAAQSPFAYFVDHSDPELLRAVREGRAREMGADGELDPGAPETFARSCLTPVSHEEDRLAIRRLYGDLLALRKSNPVFTDPVAHTRAVGESDTLTVLRRPRGSGLWFACNTGGEVHEVEVPPGTWRLVLDSDDSAYGGPGEQAPGGVVGPARVTLRAESFVCYLEENRDA
jgi:maltooligosyltrehalose trehalohydrolase